MVHLLVIGVFGRRGHQVATPYARQSPARWPGSKVLRFAWRSSRGWRPWGVRLLDPLGYYVLVHIIPLRPLAGLWSQLRFGQTQL